MMGITQVLATDTVPLDKGDRNGDGFGVYLHDTPREFND